MDGKPAEGGVGGEGQGLGAMRLVQEHVSPEEWTALVSGFQDLSLMQTWEYGEAKARTGPWQVVRLAFGEGDRLVGACQAMVRPLPIGRGGLVWINQAPLWRRPGEKGDRDLLARMLAELRRYWVEERRLYLRLALPLEHDEGGGNFSPPAGYAWVPGAGGWASARLDLSPGAEALRAGLSHNWRKQLSRAERQGVTARVGRSPELFDRFLENYGVFLGRKGLPTPLTKEFLRELQALLPEARRLWVSEGWQGTDCLGSLLLAGYGETAMFLALGLSDAGEIAHGGFVIHWQAVLAMKAAGFRWLDLGGADPRRTPPGILQFKSGLRGRPYRLVDELEAGRGVISRALRWYIRHQPGMEA
jgi:hypothetical protein